VAEAMGVKFLAQGRLKAPTWPGIEPGTLQLYTRPDAVAGCYCLHKSNYLIFED